MANADSRAGGTHQSPPGGVAALERGHLLVVDDDDNVRTVSALLLRRQGYVVTEAGDGTEALACFVANPDRFSALLVDLRMPGMDGAAFLAAVRAIRPTQAVIAMSGHAQRDAMRSLGDHAIEGFLQKPFSPEALFALVATTVTTNAAR